jgi:ribosome-associated protein
MAGFSAPRRGSVLEQGSGLATKKNRSSSKPTSPTPREHARPAMKSSHERVLEGRPTKKRPKRAAHRPAAVPTPARARPPKKVRADAQADVRRERDDAAGWSVASEVARERATAIAVAALDKKALGIEILDVAGKVDYADFLVLMTGRSDRHAQALAQGIEEALKVQGVRPIAVEGLPHASWVLIDFGDVVVHVFQDEARQLYDIEGLWLDAQRLPVPPVG